MVKTHQPSKSFTTLLDYFLLPWVYTVLLNDSTFKINERNQNVNYY